MKFVSNTEELIEFKRCAEDPIYFISNYCYVWNGTDESNIYDRANSKVLLKLSDEQQNVIKSFVTEKKVVWQAERSTGETTTILAAYVYWFARFKQDVICMCATPNRKMGDAIRSIIWYMHQNMPDFMKLELDVNCASCMGFDNHSKIFYNTIGISATRGMRLDLLAIDEPSIASDRDLREMMDFVHFSIGTNGGSLIIVGDKSLSLSTISDDIRFAFRV